MHHSDLYDSIKTVCLKNLVPELNAEMLLANQIAGCLNLNISKTIVGTRLILCMQLNIY